MKFSPILLASLAEVASAHYFFDVVDSTSSFQYVRDFTRATKYNPIKFSSNPAADIRDNSYVDGDDIICNQGGSGTGGKTSVLEVNAGDKISFTLGVGATLQHPGPTLFYMSKADGDVTSYDGSGDWFKIDQQGVCNTSGDFTSDAWCNYDSNTVSTTIPAGVPDGEYLVRVEHIGIHRSHVNQPEHYVSCAQVKVSGGGNGSPSPTTKFPGAYKDSDAYASFSIYGGFKDFPFPGPAVWDGASSGSGSGTETGSDGATETTVSGNPTETETGSDNGTETGNDNATETETGSDNGSDDNNEYNNGNSGSDNTETDDNTETGNNTEADNNTDYNNGNSGSDNTQTDNNTDGSQNDYNNEYNNDNSQSSSESAGSANVGSGCSSKRK